MSRFELSPRPFLKWVGGKGQLLPELLSRVQQAGPFLAYHEPFIGGGALFFELCRRGLLRGDVYLSDANASLIETYQSVRNQVDLLIELLLDHKARHCEDYYYAVRATIPADSLSRAARIIYLNKTCYNGLFRENRKGLFNVPFGRYKNPQICDEPNLRAVSEALQRAHIEVGSFETILLRATPGDLVYFDPPYHPVSKTSSFTAYSKGGFDEEKQRQLARVYSMLSVHGTKAILSNSMTEMILHLYQDFALAAVFATRMVNSRAAGRGKIPEALVVNF